MCKSAAQRDLFHGAFLSCKGSESQVRRSAHTYWSSACVWGVKPVLLLLRIFPLPHSPQGFSVGDCILWQDSLLPLHQFPRAWNMPWQRRMLCSVTAPLWLFMQGWLSQVFLLDYNHHCNVSFYLNAGAYLQQELQQPEQGFVTFFPSQPSKPQWLFVS